MLYQWAKPPENGGKTNPLDRVVELTKISGDTQLVEWLCEQAGGIFLRNLDMGSKDRPYLGRSTTEAIKLLTEMIQILVQSYEDHVVTMEEAAKIRDRWEQLKLQLEAYVVCCEKQLFIEPNAVKSQAAPKAKNNSKPSA